MTGIIKHASLSLSILNKVKHAASSLRNKFSIKNAVSSAIGEHASKATNNISRFFGGPRINRRMGAAKTNFADSGMGVALKHAGKYKGDGGATGHMVQRVARRKMQGNLRNRMLIGKTLRNKYVAGAAVGGAALLGARHMLKKQPKNISASFPNLELALFGAQSKSKKPGIVSRIFHGTAAAGLGATALHTGHAAINNARAASYLNKMAKNPLVRGSGLGKFAVGGAKKALTHAGVYGATALGTGAFAIGAYKKFRKKPITAAFPNLELALFGGNKNAIKELRAKRLATKANLQTKLASSPSVGYRRFGQKADRLVSGKLQGLRGKNFASASTHAMKQPLNVLGGIFGHKASADAANSAFNSRTARLATRSKLKSTLQGAGPSSLLRRPMQHAARFAAKNKVGLAVAGGVAGAGILGGAIAKGFRKKPIAAAFPNLELAIKHFHSPDEHLNVVAKTLGKKIGNAVNISKLNILGTAKSVVGGAKEAVRAGQTRGARLHKQSALHGILSNSRLRSSFRRPMQHAARFASKNKTRLAVAGGIAGAGVLGGAISKGFRKKPITASQPDFTEAPKKQLKKKYALALSLSNQMNEFVKYADSCLVLDAESRKV